MGLVHAVGFGAVGWEEEVAEGEGKLYGKGDCIKFDFGWLESVAKYFELWDGFW